MTLWIGLPVEPVGDPGRAPKCYAQVAKSPSDHQGAGIRCKSKSFYYPARAGAPTNTEAAAIRRSPEFWVTLLI